ncbi:hypothetical protein ACFFHJ_39605 [Planotetraspora thailandica]|uniref:hypothetical protein n=1 Tax=Planotetraspora thailandica TaxID=487172 RepID=UPI00194EAA2A|nr:hypothetical protein [Planotetraspora thailandica]
MSWSSQRFNQPTAQDKHGERAVNELSRRVLVRCLSPITGGWAVPRAAALGSRGGANARVALKAPKTMALR